jgi:hypothetical protein
VTAQGHPRAIFTRAIERGNLMGAQMTARELGRITLSESLALTALATHKAPERRSRYAVRWLRRLIEENEHLTTRRRCWRRLLLQRSVVARTSRPCRRFRPWRNVRLRSEAAARKRPEPGRHPVGKRTTAGERSTPTASGPLLDPAGAR